jgi:hypothetical protein
MKNNILFLDSNHSETVSYVNSLILQDIKKIKSFKLYTDKISKGESPESILQKLDQIQQVTAEGGYNTVIKGSISSLIVSDIVSNLNYQQTKDKWEEVVRRFSEFNNLYNMSSLLLINRDSKEIDEAIIRGLVGIDGMDITSGFKITLIDNTQNLNLLQLRKEVYLFLKEKKCAL